MIWRNTIERYGAVHKTLHWVIALLVLMMLVMGIVMEDIPRGPDKFWVYGIHKSIGITILALMLARLGWKIMNWSLPRPLPTHERWEQKLAALVHWGFYALLIAMPLSGWLMTAAANSTVNWFGFFVVPNPIGPNEDIQHFMHDTHDILAWIIWGFLAFHLGGVAKHLVIDRDGTLRRMLPFGAFILFLPMIAHAAELPSWTIDSEKSTLTFEATQENAPFSGAFKAFNGNILFDPEKPEGGTASIIIGLNSVDTKNEERDTTLQEADWFDVATSPTAAYHIDRFEKGATDGSYIGKGRLVLRGLERPLDLPFTLSLSEGEHGTRIAHVVGQTTLNRLDFGLGDGQWANPGMVGHEIVVKIDITATAKR